MPPPDPRLPVAIVTGFLGSGKTTLLNHVLRHESMRASLVLVNEFGEIGIDHLLVETAAENLVLLGNGCLCCALQGELVETLTDLHRRREAGGIPPFDRVLIETSGLADPVPIMRSVVSDEALREVYRLQGVVTVVDGVHGEAQLESSAEALKQAAVADRVLISKSDLADAGRIENLRARLHALNPTAPIAAALHGAIDGRSLLEGAGSFEAAESFEGGTSVEAAGSMAVDPLGLANRSASSDSRYVAFRPAAGPRHDEAIRTFSFRFDRPVRRAGLRLWLDKISALRGENLLRLKGVLNVEGEPVAVHVVQTVVHEPTPLGAWPDPERASRIVVIGRAIDATMFERTFEAFDYFETETAGEPDASLWDTDAYARFLRAMQALR